METKSFYVTVSADQELAFLRELEEKKIITIVPDYSIPEWQILESRHRLTEMKSDPSSCIDGDKFFEMISDD